MPRVTDEHRAARRAQILSAAVRCVVREGFHKTTMADVIAESGLSAGAVYGYFKGKPDLIRAIAEQAIGEAAASLEQAIEGPGPVDVVEVFGSLVHYVARLHSELGHGIAAVHAWSEAARDDTVREVLGGRIQAIHANWVLVLDRAEADGTLAPGGDHDAMARSLVGLMPGFLVQGPLLGVVGPDAYVEGLAGLLGRARS